MRFQYNLSRQDTGRDELAPKTLFPGLALRVGDLFALPELED